VLQAGKDVISGDKTVSDATTKAGQTVQQGLASLQSGLQSDTTALTGAGKEITSATAQQGSDWLVRAVLIIVGAALLWAALGMLGHGKEPVAE
jgi:hypothetical protein